MPTNNVKTEWLMRYSSNRFNVTINIKILSLILFFGVFQTFMLDIMHFLKVLYLCIITPYTAMDDSQSDAERVIYTIVIAGLLLNIYVQLTTAIVDKVRELNLSDFKLELQICI